MKNIFSLSEEKTDFKTALTEWKFTGEIVVYEEPIEICNLCEHPNLRYHYEIENVQLRTSLMVGSNCIDKFDITVIGEDGIEITENKEAYLIARAQKKHIKDAFDKLIATKPMGSMVKRSGVNIGKEYRIIELDEACKSDYYLHGKMDARMLNYLFLRFEQEGVFCEKRFFKIKLNSQEAKDKLLSLDRKQYDRTKVALSVSQRKYYEGNF